MKIFKIAYILLIYFILSTSAFAANHYIRAGAIGANNGNNWTDAWTDLPTSFVRGDTYYVADGNYGAHVFNTANSGTTYIYIKKATASVHGTDTGWNASYGDGQAVFYANNADIWTISTGYWDFDDVTGCGPGSWETGHGFKVVPIIHPTVQHGYRGVWFSTSSADYINIKHTEIVRYDLTPAPYGWECDLVYANAASDHVNIQYCWIHTTYRCPFKLVGVADWTIEYTKAGDNYGTENWHSEIIAGSNIDRMTLRYNYFYKWRSTGAIYMTLGYGTISEDWKIYGNIFDQGGTATWIIFAFYTNDINEHNYARRFRIHNNTFIGLTSPGGSSDKIALTVFSVTGEGDNQMYNNLFWNTSGVLDFDGISGLGTLSGIEVPIHDYNWYSGSSVYGESNGIAGGSTNPFVDSSSDFHLTSAIPGLTLGTTYIKTMDGATRGIDGVYDRGAFDYNSGNEYLRSIVPLPPENLRIK
jgi:hypothetical protein